jgi:EAL domain-containing protein (putative c-di-GMP-specific phosphodiesterase class I)
VKLCLLSMRLPSMQASQSYQMLIDAAERQGVAQAYDHHLLAAAIELLARSQSSPTQLCCLVPVSASVLETAATYEFVRGRLAAQGVRGQGLCFLFDEALASAHTSRLMAFAQQVRALGCQIALGRFGAGSTSFALLHTLAPSYIQISPSLTRSLPGTNSLTALLRAILDITAEHGVPAIAGDVADVPTLETLAEQGIAYAYGPVIAPREPHLAWFEGVVMRGQVVPD